MVNNFQFRHIASLNTIFQSLITVLYSSSEVALITFACMQFTDDNCQHLIDVIESMDHYISAKLPEQYDRMMRQRDKALITMNHIFFK